MAGVNEPRANYFAHATAAERYAKYRPYFHPEMVERLVRFTECAHFERVLDVACGTGQSTKALAGIAGQLDAVDNSAAMLAHAPALPNVTYQKAEAETLPFPDGTFDLVTVGLAFHWFEQDQFLREAARVLKTQGWLAIYNNVFTGEMAENPDFRQWLDKVYLTRYLTPPKPRKKLTTEYATAHGFQLVGRQNFINKMPMTADQLAGYFSTQSNVIGCVEQGGETLADARAWLDREVEPFFRGEIGTMEFRTSIFFLRKKLTVHERRLHKLSRQRSKGK